mgnify:CR=1 FL=1
MEIQLEEYLMIPLDMDVPELRRDTSDPSNVRWLLRNLSFRNKDHPQFSLVMDKLKNQTRADNKARKDGGQT